MKELLSELQNACHNQPSSSDTETIGRGVSTWFTGRPAHVAEGSVALALSDEARVVIRNGDVVGVKKEGEQYSVAVSADAHVLLRIDKVLKATVERRCHCGNTLAAKPDTGGRRPPPIDIDIGPITVCEIVCGDVNLMGHVVHVCVPVNCRTEPPHR